MSGKDVALHSSTRSGPMPREVTAVRLTSEHMPAIKRFYETAWNARPSSNAPLLRPEAPAFGVLIDGRIVGYTGTIPIRLWDGRSEHAAHWIKGLMVLPEYRDSGIGFFVLREAAQNLGIAGSLSVAPAAHRLFRAVGFRDIGVLTNQITLLRPANVLRALDLDALGLGQLPKPLAWSVRLAQRSGLATLAGHTLGVGASVWRQTFGRIPHRMQVRHELPIPETLDKLWHRMRVALYGSTVRDAAYLGTRYFRGTDSGYTGISVWEGGELSALAIVRRPRTKGDPRLRGIRVAVIADLLAPPERVDAMIAAIRGAEEAALEAGADALLCSTSAPRLSRLLSRQGYVALPGTIRLLLKSGEQLPADIGSWWITRGDGNADGI